MRILAIAGYHTTSHALLDRLVRRANGELESMGVHSSPVRLILNFLALGRDVLVRGLPTHLGTDWEWRMQSLALANLVATPSVVGTTHRCCSTSGTRGPRSGCTIFRGAVRQ